MASAKSFHIRIASLICGERNIGEKNSSTLTLWPGDRENGGENEKDTAKSGSDYDLDSNGVLRML